MTTDLSSVIYGFGEVPKDAPDATVQSLQAALSKPNVAVRLERFYHEASNLYFWIVGMSTDGYRETEPQAVAQFVNGRKISTDKDDAVNLLVAYFMHGLELADGSAVTREQAYQMATRKGYGASNEAMLSCIRSHNPRTGNPLDALTLHWGFNRWIALQLHMFHQSGLWTDVCKRLAMTDDEITALSQYQKEYEALTGLEHFAKQLGVPFGAALEIRKQQILEQQAA